MAGTTVAYSDSEIHAAWVRHGSYMAAAGALGINRATVSKAAKRHAAAVPDMANVGYKPAPVAAPAPAPAPRCTNPSNVGAIPAPSVRRPRPSDGYWHAPGVQMPHLPSDAPTAAQIIERRMSRFGQIDARKSAEQWMPFRFETDEPIAILWVGDPHADDDACNWPLLMRHIELARTPGVYAVNIGDTTNNWVGRLMRKFADQETTQTEARILAKWLLSESGLRWLLWLVGNHDEWNEGGAILRLLAGEQAIVQSWMAQFELKFPNGVDVKCHAAHGMKGHSMWHATHGGLRTAKMQSDAELLVSGHIHEWGTMAFEQPSRERITHVVSVRGYKWHDEYAVSHGFEQGKSGASILTVINPRATDPAGRITPFVDVEMGIACLEALRARARH